MRLTACPTENPSLLLTVFMPASSLPSASPDSATSASSSRSAAADRSEIATAIQHYFRAGDLGSSAELRAAFHPTAMMFWLAPSGQVAALAQRAWQQRLDANRSPVAAIERRIDWIRITGDGASAKLTSRFATFEFIDYVVLLKAGGRWQIVGKVFHRREPVDAPLNADAAADRGAIEALIATKFRAMDSNDATGLARVYAARAVTFTTADAQLVTVPIAEWEARYDESRANGTAVVVATHRIVEIDVGGTAAFVELAHDLESTTVVDYALLLRTGDGWRILDLVYLARP